jgi:hypothetical protein
MTGKRVLMVEGPDDEHVVKNLCSARTLDKIDHVHPYGGKDPLIEGIPARRSAAALPIIEDLVKWENTTNETVLQAARDEIWQSWRAPAPRTPTTRARRSSSTGRSCRRSTTPSPAAARCRWRRSGSGSRATPATSTRWRC